ncbi:MAG: zinc finger domain-containing protein [Candidatus Rokuibacteriota bacterium]
MDRAPGDKCERCWTRSPEVGRDAEHPTLCDRCVAVLRA